MVERLALKPLGNNALRAYAFHLFNVNIYVTWY